MRRASALAALALGACSTSAGEPAPARAAAPDPAVVSRGELDERILLTGQIEAASKIELLVPRTSQWQLSVRWLAKSGAEVAAGDKLVELDNSVFVTERADKALRLRQAALDYAALRAQTAMALADKQFAVARDRVQLERAELLASVPADLLAARDVQERQLARERARVALTRAELDLRSHQEASALELQVKRIEADKVLREVEAAEESIAALTLTAPRAGVVLIDEHPWEDRTIQVGDMLQPGWTVATLPDASAMVVEAYLSDVDDGRLAPGAPVRCTLDAYPELTFAGTVRELSPVAHEVARGSLRRAFRVVIDLERTDPERMRPGFSVKVEVPGRRHQDALLVPRGALEPGPDGPRAVLAGGERVAVTLGACDAQRCVVTAGLDEGQRLGAGGPR